MSFLARSGIKSRELGRASNSELLAIRGEARLETFLRWSDAPLVKLAEGGLVFLLLLHMLGGLRLLVLENLDWRNGQKQLATIAAAVSAVIAFIFLAHVF